jgi:hypothetical protein
VIVDEIVGRRNARNRKRLDLELTRSVVVDRPEENDGGNLPPPRRGGE